MMEHLESGYVLGKYRIHEELGRGGMGVVYSAEDTVLGRLVALKVLPKDLMSDRAFVKKFRDEAKVIASLSHPNVVHVHAFEIIGDVPVIEMEYIEGGPLSRRFQQEHVEKSDVIHYAHGVASALAYCHAMDAVHRDVKPSNVLIDKLNTARLADFGIAKFLDAREQSTFAHSVSGVFQGTPLYAPPEAWEGETPTRAWDIYGLGAVIYQGLTGSPPYQANTPLQLVKMVANTSIPPLKKVQPQVSDELAELVDEMLRPDPKGRPDNAEVVRRRLQKTPEFASYASDTRTLIPVRGQRRRKSLRAVPGRKRNAAIAVGIVLVLVAISFLSWAIRQFLVGDVAEPRDNAASAKPAANEPLPPSGWDSLTATSTVAELEALPRNVAGASSIVLQARIHGTPARPDETWLVGISEAGEPAKILAFSESNIAVIELSPGAEQSEYAASGNWAGYADIAGSILRYGAVQGEIMWRPEVSAFMGNLVFLDEQDGHSLGTTVIAAEHTTFRTATQFCIELERSDYLLPMLYGELLPRDLAWAHEIDAVLPSFERGAARVHAASVENGAIVVDGILGEPCWSPLGSEDDSPEYVLNGWPRDGSPRISLSLSGDALLVGLTCAAGPEAKTAVLDLSLMEMYPIPLSAAPFLHIRYSPAASQIIGVYGAGQADGELPGCEFVSTVNGGALVMEGRIPVQAFGRQANEFASGERWRLNAVLSTADDSGKRTAVCRWGYPDEAAVRHGAVFVLD